MFSDEPAAEMQPSPKDTTPGITIPVIVMEKIVPESKDPNSNAHHLQSQFPDLRDSDKFNMFMEAKLDFLRRAIVPSEEHEQCTLSPILDNYLSIWSEICIDKSDILHHKIENLHMLDVNLMTTLVAVKQKRDELYVEFNGYEDYSDDEETPEFREVYCPNCDESSEEDESEDLCHYPIHPNIGTAYLASWITTNPWKKGPTDEDEEPADTTATGSASNMANSTISEDEDDCGCLCATCLASRGLDSDDDSYVSDSEESESEDEMPCQC
ncbi:hypothetical protein EAE96_000766 [Botrytis aclada]|nr:hypothetical protein EAE96_000766 [Botrytis aclada]